MSTAKQRKEWAETCNRWPDTMWLSGVVLSLLDDIDNIGGEMNTVVSAGTFCIQVDVRDEESTQVRSLDSMDSDERRVLATQLRELAEGIES